MKVPAGHNSSLSNMAGMISYSCNCAIKYCALTDRHKDFRNCNWYKW